MKTVLPILLLSAAALPTLARAEAPLPPSDEEGIVVTASRSGEPAPTSLTGASVTTLGPREIEDRGTREVADVLRDVPGLSVSRIAGFTQVRLRGTEANHTLVLIDGIEASDPFVGEFDFGTLLADSSARIEVLRGQQSALYGSDAIGGVIHYITLSGAEDPGARFRLETGSFATFSGSARLAGVSGDLDYAGSATFFATRGAPNARRGRRDIGRDSEAASLKLQWRAAANLRFIAVGRYAHLGTDINNADQDFTSPTYGYTVDTPGSFVRNDAFYGLVRGELDTWSGRWTHALSAQFAYVCRKGFDRKAFSYGDEGERRKVSYESVLRLGGDRLRHLLTFAVDVEREAYRNLDPSGFVFTGRRHTDNIGFVGAYELFAADRFSLGASLRRDLNDRFRDATTWRLQGSYLLRGGARLHAAAGTGVKNPLYYELFGYVDGRFVGNPDLKPERSEGWEAGLEQRLAGGAAMLGATYFRNVLRHEIAVDFPPPLFIASPFNRRDRSRQQGVELYGRVKLGGGWRIDAAYTWLRAREAGQEEVRRAPHVASANLGWRAPGDRAGIALSVRHNGAQKDLAYTDPASFTPVRVTLKGYTLVNLNADWKLTDRLSLFAHAENLLDDDYEEVFSFRSPGRAAYAGLRARF